MNPINAAKTYLENHPTLSHMLDGGTFELNQHNSAVDAHMINHLDEVSNDHLDLTPSQTVTVTKDITTEDGFTIPKIVKIQMSTDNDIQNVVESK